MPTKLVSAQIQRDSLRNYWLPLEFSDRISPRKPYGTHVLGRPVVLFRDQAGTIICLEDHCPHRGTPLSLGSVKAGQLRCTYHGWEFDGRGRCTRIPSAQDGNIRSERPLITRLPTADRAGLVWVWPGEPDAADVALIPVPAPPAVDEEYAVLREHYDLGIHYSLLLSNLSDPAHVQFVHPSILARFIGQNNFVVRFLDVTVNADGWPTARTEVENGGRINHYQYMYQSPFLITKVINGWFGKKPMTNYHWEFAVPLKRNLTRFFFLQYRTFFNSWLARLALGRLYERMAKTTAEEDRRVLEGQQSRLEQGAEFRALASSDRLLRPYHDKINSIERAEDWFSHFDSPLVDAASVSQSAIRQNIQQREDVRAEASGLGPSVARSSEAKPDSLQPR